MTNFVVQTSTTEKAAIDLQIERFVCATNPPFTIVEHPEFLKLMATLRPGYHLFQPKPLKVYHAIQEEEDKRVKALSNKDKEDRDKMLLSLECLIISQLRNVMRNYESNSNFRY